MADLAVRIHGRWLLVGAGGLALAGALAAGAIWYLQAHDAFGVPREVRQAAPFNVYYVRNTPPPLEVDRSSYTYRSGVLSFVIERPDDTGILVSEQVSPRGLDIDKFVNDELTEPRAVITPYGKAVVGLREKRRVASLKIGSTWIMMSGPESASADELARLMEHLQLQS